MASTFAMAALWMGLALVAIFLGSRLKVSNALRAPNWTSTPCAASGKK